ncbi:hypothetical protein [Herpetosiphon llansteffanensis]|uniref:hypothetical protein n=1 Tax=Herpetosiphon llansteffanensis TaxID=2094568 RepID=UPI000D7BEA6E|nr:hypothetical protein [Herpetosiphon llansteffanensis]
MTSSDIQEDIAHYQELVRSYKKTLRVLELQASKFGVHVPAHIEIDIESTKEKISLCEEEIKNLNNILLSTMTNQSSHSQGIHQSTNIDASMTSVRTSNYEQDNKPDVETTYIPLKGKRTMLQHILRLLARAATLIACVSLAFPWLQWEGQPSTYWYFGELLSHHIYEIEYNLSLTALVLLLGLIPFDRFINDVESAHWRLLWASITSLPAWDAVAYYFIKANHSISMFGDNRRDAIVTKIPHPGVYIMLISYIIIFVISFSEIKIYPFVKVLPKTYKIAVIGWCLLNIFVLIVGIKYSDGAAIARTLIVSVPVIISFMISSRSINRRL